MRGWIYVISNKAMPGLVKVGYSAKDPELRAQELDNTGIPHAYVVEYDMLIEEPDQVEQQVHALLSSCLEGKEWFRCEPEEAVSAIKRVAGDRGITEFFNKVLREKAERLQAEKDLEIAREQERLKAERDLEIMKQQQRGKRIKSDQNVRVGVSVSCSNCFRKYSVSLKWRENRAICPFCGGITIVNIQW